MYRSVLIEPQRVQLEILDERTHRWRAISVTTLSNEPLWRLWVTRSVPRKDLAKSSGASGIPTPAEWREARA